MAYIVGSRLVSRAADVYKGNKTETVLALQDIQFRDSYMCTQGGAAQYVYSYTYVLEDTEHAPTTASQYLGLW